MELSECFFKAVEVLKNICSDLKLYLAGNVLMIAETDEDIEKFLYAATYPPYIELRDIDILRRSLTVVVKENVIALTDIKSYSIAKLLASELARVLEKYMPFDIEGVDLVVAYRSSEDGGLYTRYEVKVYIRNIEVVDDVREEVAKVLQHLGIEFNRKG